MKYVVIFILATALLIGMNFLIPETEQPSISELKIGAYVFADETMVDPNEHERKEITKINKTKFCFKELELGKTYLLAPVTSTEVVNLCFDVEFADGIVEMISVNKDIQLSVASDSKFHKANVSHQNRQFGYSMKVSDKGKISGNPIGSGGGYKYITDENMRTFRGYTGREYMISVNAYEFDDEDAAVITAQLKLTQLQDNYANTLVEGASRFYSVELVSYVLGDRYQMILDSLK